MRRGLMAGFLFVMLFLIGAGKEVRAENTKPLVSTCLAVAQQLDDMNAVPVHFASFKANSNAFEVAISFQGHSTYLIQSPENVTAATDYAGWLSEAIIPDIVTMNQAHSSHYTDFPDPKIKHVLKGWGEGADIARHHIALGDMMVRNVTTDLLRFTNIPDGNSIFIFETAGLCIGHLGHLHHELSEDHYAKIGRLDVVMVPVDGGLTMSHASAKEILKRLRSSVILPMHVRSHDALPRFLNGLKDEFVIEYPKEKVLKLSLRTLPKVPTIMVLPGVASFTSFND